jgi:polyphosphate glucokinase
MRILSIDIGGTGLKASVIDQTGKMLAPRQRVETPHPCPPALLLKTVGELVKPLPAFERISIAFPGVVRDGKVLTAPNLGTAAWARLSWPRDVGASAEAGQDRQRRRDGASASSRHRAWSWF